MTFDSLMDILVPYVGFPSGMIFASVMITIGFVNLLRKDLDSVVPFFGIGFVGGAIIALFFPMLLAVSYFVWPYILIVLFLIGICFIIAKIFVYITENFQFKRDEQ